MSIDANDLILFARVVEAGSFSSTTALTGLPKSTVSRRIAQLESHLGERLLVRNTRRLVVSEFGERILEHAARLRDESEAVLDFALHRQDTPCGVLRVSMMPELVEIGLGELCHEFATKYPEVRLDLDLSPRRVDLLSERFDIALRGAAHLPDDSMLVARKLCEFRLGLYASAEYLARHGIPECPEDLRAHACLPLVASSGASFTGSFRAEATNDWNVFRTVILRPILQGSCAISLRPARASASFPIILRMRCSSKAGCGGSWRTGIRPWRHSGA